MSDEFKSSWLCWARGKSHVVDLHKRTQAFFKTKPYTYITEPDPEGVYQLHKIKLTSSLPDELAVITADAVNNLRAALDQAGFAVTKASGVINPKNACFPFGLDSSDFEARFKGKSKDFPEQIRPFLRIIKPYKGGNDLLWALNRICNANKHRMLAPISIGFIRIRSSMVLPAGYHSFEPPRWDHTNQELIFPITGVDTKFDDNMDLALDIAFDEVDIVQGQPTIPILCQLISLVSAILIGLEMDAVSFGLIS